MSAWEDRCAGVRLRWDVQAGVTPGWYAEYVDSEGELLSDSMKIDSPVEVDSFSRAQVRELVAALSAAFPGAVVWTAPFPEAS